MVVGMAPAPRRRTATARTTPTAPTTATPATSTAAANRTPASAAADVAAAIAPPRDPATRKGSRVGRQPQSTGAGKLAREDWADAALYMAAEAGVGAVGVEPLARRLGVTKGSFYWHFANRGELIEVAMRRFQDVGTIGVIAHLERLPDARARLEAVMRLAFTEEAGGRLLLAMAASDEAAVQGALARITATRIDYLAHLLRQLGKRKDAARRGAVRAYASYVGLYYVAAVSPAHALSEPDKSRMVDELVESLLR
jgi:AcrR family transcriptional regulator